MTIAKDEKVKVVEMDAVASFLWLLSALVTAWWMHHVDPGRRQKRRRVPDCRRRRTVVDRGCGISGSRTLTPMTKRASPPQAPTLAGASTSASPSGANDPTFSAS